LTKYRCYIWLYTGSINIVAKDCFSYENSILWLLFSIWYWSKCIPFELRYLQALTQLNYGSIKATNLNTLLCIHCFGTIFSLIYSLVLNWYQQMKLWVLKALSVYRVFGRIIKNGRKYLANKFPGDPYNKDYFWVSIRHIASCYLILYRYLLPVYICRWLGQFWTFTLKFIVVRLWILRLIFYFIFNLAVFLGVSFLSLVYNRIRLLLASFYKLLLPTKHRLLFFSLVLFLLNIYWLYHFDPHVNSFQSIW